MIAQSIPHYPVLTLALIGIIAFLVIGLMILMAYRHHLTNDQGSNHVLECEVTCDILGDSIHANALRVNEEAFMKNVEEMLSSRPYYLSIKDYKGSKLTVNPFHYNGKLIWIQPDDRIFESTDGMNWTDLVDPLPIPKVDASTVVGAVIGIKSITNRKAIFKLEIFPGHYTKYIIKKLSLRSFRLIVEPSFERDVVLGMNSSMRDTVVGVKKFYLVDRSIQRD